MDNFSNYGGYGFWCNKACAERKMASGIPPLGAGRKEEEESQGDLLLAQAALEQSRKEDGGLSALQITGIIVASIAAIGGLVFVIRKTRKGK